ncbi:uncharacterized protein LOC116162377 [Photinus pyralis]|nr:uncharacterized protein LOC116162377 [Photinus pyralis]
MREWYEKTNLAIGIKLKTVSHEVKKCSIKLHEMKLPVFSGGYEHWVTFQDIFEKVIHASKTVSATEKMQYLKSHVTGEASRLIQHLQIAECNYDTAWSILKNRYNNERLIVGKLIDKILDFPKIEQESADAIRRLHDTTHECLKAISNQGIETIAWGPIVARIIARTWDAESNKLFEQSLKTPNKTPSLQELMEFLKMRFQSLEVLSQARKVQHESIQGHQRWQNNRQQGCAYCKQQHKLGDCNKFKELSPANRLGFVKERQLCVNCMNHNCNSKCRSFRRCATCQYPHHTILHQDYEKSAVQKPAVHASTAKEVKTGIAGKNEVLLATALVRVEDAMGELHVLRALVDPGSQASFITEQAAQVLRLPRQAVRAEISGLGRSEPTKATSKITIQLRPRHSSTFTLATDVVILKRITGELPSKSFEFNTDRWRNQLLADPTLNKPGPIDILLGAEDYANIIMDGIRKEDSCLAQNSELGWILSGQIHTPKGHNVTLISMVSRATKNTQLERFWELEEIPGPAGPSKQDTECEQHYQETTVRNTDGTYTVRIPFKEDPSVLESARPVAVARLVQLEKKFLVNTKLEKEYKAFMQEYLELGHMKLATNPQEKRIYIPHQAVIKESSATTKLRVVFDASSRPAKGKSLNEVMHVGPRLQQDLWSLLVRWRKHRYAITADVEKMYRQIKLDKRDHRYHTVLWRFAPQEQIREYQLTTVTYGTASAPYLAVRTLQQLARDEAHNYPKAAQ